MGGRPQQPLSTGAEPATLPSFPPRMSSALRRRKRVKQSRANGRDAGTSISEIFSLYGQAAYRRYERRALQTTIDSYERFVLVPGGSIVSEPATFDVLLTSCQTIWIKASPEEHMARVVAQGDRRPMIDNDEAMRDLRRILAGREPMYSKADAVVDTSGCSIEESFARLEAGLQG